MPNTQLQLIEELLLLHSQERKDREAIREEKESRYLQALEALCESHRQEKKRIYEQYICPFIDTYTFLNRKSFLAIIKKEGQETYHSCLLAEVWNPETESGSASLTDFLKTAGVKGDWLESVARNKYSIKTEHPTGRCRKQDLCHKRIDLLIKDDTHKWVVAIENKIFSKVHADKISGRDQLKIYKDYCERHFPDYKQAYVLLSHGNNESYARKNVAWRYANYYGVMKSLLPHCLHDKVMQDYSNMLYSFLFPRKQFDKGLYNAETSLYEYHKFIKQVISKIQ